MKATPISGDIRKTEKIRYDLLDVLRGASVISMIVYHAIWDVVYILGFSVPWYGDMPGVIWQQSICWSFIFISGFCGVLGSKTLRSGIIVSASGLLVSAVTVLVIPENRVIFGVLTLLGTCMIIAWLVKKTPLMSSPLPSALVCAALFILTKNINKGFLGFGPFNFIKLPSGLYSGTVSSFFGFTSPDFFSTDYFSLFPWAFLFFTGFFLSAFLREKDAYPSFLKKNFPPLSFIGRHSLIIYLLHQPVLYLMCMLFFQLNER